MELWEGSNHVLYEVQMLSNSAALLEDDGAWNKGWGWESKTLYMVSLESFLTHARSLMDFICPPSDWATRAINERGIFADDYCSSPWKPQPWPSLRDEHKQVSREIEHLTFDRPAVGRNWPYAEMLNKLRAKLLDFLREANLMSDHVKEQLRGILVDGVRVSVGDASPPAGLAIPTSAITSVPAAGVSGATTGMIDPSLVEHPHEGEA